MPCRLSLVAVAATLLFASAVSAGDWPQILGPHRNGTADDESLATKWPGDGLKKLWQRDVGRGLAGVAVADGKAVLFHRVDDREVAEAMDAATGDRLWKTDFPATYIPSYIADDGPRCVPVIHQGRVYLYGARGNLHCVELRTGKAVWSRDTFRDYNSKRPVRGEPPEGYFGIGSSPIVVDDRLLVNIGGDAAGAGIVAFALDDGRTLWKATSERASYSSPIAATLDGRRHVIFATRLSAVSVDPANGDVRFRFPYGATGPKVTGANPVLLKNHLFFTASYGVGAALVRVGESGAEEVWADDEILSSQYTTPVEHEGYLYGIHGRQDVGLAELRCIDPKTKKVLWTQPDFGYATLIEADGKLLIQKTEGDLILAELTPKAYRPLGRATLSSQTVRALPALSNGRWYIRNEQTLACFELPQQ